jgi:alpha-L-rhamnosidase
MIFSRYIFFVFALTFSSMSYAQDDLAPGILTVEYIENPLGINTDKPRFSWTLLSNGRNKMQTAYEIVVSENLQELKQGKGSAWSTGKVSSSQTLHIVYNGIALKPFTRYFWMVKVYDEKDKSLGFNKTAWFETAMLQPSDWQAQWISDGSTFPEKDELYYQPDPMPLFRKGFAAKKKIASARLYISGMGYYEAYLNGKKIGDHVLDPGWTTYRKQALYVVHDITSLVKNGNNVAGIMVGNGWWNPLPFRIFGRWLLRDYQETGRPCVKAEIHIRYADGQTETIVTDPSWQTAPGPVMRNNVYFGEHYDAREEKKDWMLASAKTGGWKNAAVAKGPSGALTVQMQPPIRVTKVVKATSVVQQGKDTFIVDMGQNFAGVARIKVKGPAGTKITMRLGEGLFADGRINLMTTVTTQIKKGGIKGGPGAPETAWQEDSYTLKGEGVEQWSPRFTFHGFRYVEITGWPGTPTVNDVEGLRMNSDLDTTGEFACSNEMFNKLHNVIQWTFLSNIFSVQSDCPGREKMGYGADMVVTANAFLYNYNMAQFYGKAVHDYANEQRPKGGITEIAPFTGIDDRGYGDLSGPLGWQLAFPYVQKQLYEFYGDKRIIETYYPALQRQIGFLDSVSYRGLFYWDISDHEALDPKPESFSASAFYYHHLMIAAEFANLLGKQEDAARYNRRAATVKRNIQNQWHVRGTGRFDNATQSAQLFALWYDLSPEKENSFKFLLQELERHNWHLSTGIFSTTFFFDVMRENDRNDIAYRVANQRSYPGWGYMLGNGATTLWESWDFPETGPSRNHPMFGSIDEWFYRSLLGINATSPGFATVRIKPQPAGDLTWAKGSYASVRGTIYSDWKKENNNFRLRVIIPANTKAEVWIPAKENAAVTEKGQTIKVSRYENGYAVIESGSGEYEFISSQN